MANRFQSLLASVYLSSGPLKTFLAEVALAAGNIFGLSNANPANVNTVASPGLSVDGSRADHVHAHGNLPGGDLHALVISGNDAGFISGADKAFLDINVRNTKVEFFGTGEDGDVVVAAPLTLTRDMYYRNLTLVAGCQIRPNGWRIFVSEELDLTNAPADAILAQSATAGGGNGAIAGGGGASGSVSSGVTIGTGTAGTTGGNGNAAAGSTAANPSPSNQGGLPATSGAGGAGSAGAGGAAVAPTQNFFPTYRLAVDLRRGGSAVIGGGGGPGGGGGGGNGANAGGGGGGGGPGGYVAQIHAWSIRRGATTAAGAINCSAGFGGNGASPVSANTGGGGGGAGGSGGWVIILTQQLLGDVAVGAIVANGGNGGNGGNGNGTGLGGAGGGGGGSGRFTLWDWNTGSFVDLFNSTPSPGSPAVGAVGGAGGAGEARSFDL